MRYERFHLSHIPGENSASLMPVDLGIASNVLDHALNRSRVESRAARYVRAESSIVVRRNVAMQSNHAAENHHDRAQARLEQTDLFLPVITRGHRSATQMEKLPERLLLDLQSKVAARDRDTISHIFTMKHAM